MNLYTIGFTKKSAKSFFDLLKKAHIKTLIDIRRNNTSQLAGFAKGNDLEYFLKEICNINYIHDINLAPEQSLLDSYKKGDIDWAKYEENFNKMLIGNNIEEYIKKNLSNILDRACLLCSEHVADNCHRRLVAEYIENNIENVSIIHL